MSEPRLVSDGPLFRLPGISDVEFSTSWHRHAELVCPWFLDFGIQGYSPIHLREHTFSSTTPKDETAVQIILRQADGVALVPCVPVKTADGSMPLFGDARKHPESGATTVEGDAAVFDLPVLTVDEWRRIALEMEAVEHVKIREGKAVTDVLWWDEWKESNEKQAG